MTRSERTVAEKKAIQPLREFMTASNYLHPEISSDVTDKPDTVFRTSRGKVACEIAHLVPAEITKWYFKKLPDLPVGQVREIVLPHEPHEWMSRIINQKSGLMNSYVSRAGTKRIWLLVHASDLTMRLLRPPTDGDLDLMKHGADRTKHRFSKILFWDYDGDVIEIQDKKQNKGIRSVNIDVSKGYPADVVREVGLGSFAGLSEKQYVDYEIEFEKLKTGETLTPDPIDRKFRKVQANISAQIEPTKIVVGEAGRDATQVDISIAFPEFGELVSQLGQNAE